VYGDNVIASGMARWEAATLLRLVEVPVIRVEHLTEEQARLFAIADNKLAEGVEWDFDALRIEFEQISIVSPEIDLDSSGFCIAERDVMIGRHRLAELADLDETPRPARQIVSVPGDVWILGRHRLVCGDSTSADIVATALNGQPVRTLLSDLPYNVKIDGNVSGKGETKHGEFAMASGEMSKTEFIDFLTRAIDQARTHMVDGALAYLFMDWRHLSELALATEACDLSQLNLLVWNKGKGGQGAFYRSAHEMIGVFKSGSEKHVNNVMMGKHGRYRTNVLTYPGVTSFGKGRAKALEMHPTVKPVALIADLILDSSAPHDVIFDPFGGSGTTLIAAEKMDRTACLIEIAPEFVDASIRRFEKISDQPAIHEATGRTFTEITRDRADKGEA
jgi:DNA modification methylase